MMTPLLSERDLADLRRRHAEPDRKRTSAARVVAESAAGTVAQSPDLPDVVIAELRLSVFGAAAVAVVDVFFHSSSSFDSWPKL